MEARELDERFDNGDDVLDLFDLSTLKRPALETQSVSVNFPQWMILSPLLGSQSKLRIADGLSSDNAKRKHKSIAKN